jgi:hypothetical protein
VLTPAATGLGLQVHQREVAARTPAWLDHSVVKYLVRLLMGNWILKERTNEDEEPRVATADVDWGPRVVASRFSPAESPDMVGDIDFRAG